jgi:hypothetical protein
MRKQHLSFIGIITSSPSGTDEKPRIILRLNTAAVKGIVSRD